LRHGSRDRLDNIKLDVHATGATVVIEANRREPGWRSWLSHNNVVETDLDVKVPRKTDLQIQVFSSPVDVTGVEGSYDVHSFSGGIRLKDTTGRMRIHSFSGAIDIRAREWRTDQTIDVDTFSGGIDLHVPETAHGTINFHSFSGNLTSGMPLSLNSTSQRSVTATLGSGEGGSLRLKTFSGNVRIDR
jgi:DUF4097 and DUF4098 domain-containing protein YvlB